MLWENYNENHNCKNQEFFDKNERIESFYKSDILYFFILGIQLVYEDFKSVNFYLYVVALSLMYIFDYFQAKITFYYHLSFNKLWFFTPLTIILSIK